MRARRPAERPLGVYVHFPYCTRRCPYCDFAVHARRRIPHEAYAEAVIAELAARAALFPGRAAVTAYFGGGTPGLWRADRLAAVLDEIRARYALALDAEVTVEVNPGELDLEHLAELRRRGVTRLSIGAQSFDDRSLRLLGRGHDARAGRTAVELARQAGFDNVSVDLIFGLPGQGRGALDVELEALLALDVEHLSLYGLTVEPRTAFAALERAGDLTLPAPERQAELYERVSVRLAAAGYAQHEISSWARPGRAARHNAIYWRQGEYLGVGSSASSLRLGAGGGERFANHRSVDRYLAACRAAGPGTDRVADDARVATTEQLGAEALAREALWLGLRLTDGIDRGDHAARFGVDPLATPAFAKLVAAGLVESDDRRVRLTSRGRLLADEVGAALV